MRIGCAWTVTSTVDASIRRNPVMTRALKILAKSVHRELKSSGYSRSDIVSFTNELLDLVTSDLRQVG